MAGDAPGGTKVVVYCGVVGGAGLLLGFLSPWLGLLCMIPLAVSYQASWGFFHD